MKPPTRRLAAGIDLGGTRLKAGLFEFGPTEGRGEGVAAGVETLAWTTAPSPAASRRESVLTAVVELARRLVTAAPYSPAALGLSLPGTVSPEAGALAVAPLLPKCDGLSFGPVLEAELGLPVMVENDANAAAFAEARWGAARAATTSVYMTLSTGLGMGIILAKEIYRGANGIAGEVGHVEIWQHGETCALGHAGCAEALATGPGIARRGSRLLGRPVGAATVFSRAKAGDAEARRIVEDAVRAVSVIVCLVRSFIDPEVVVFGGGVGLGQPWFVERVASRWRDLVDYPKPSLKIRSSELGVAASATGAAALALRKARLALDEPAPSVVPGPTRKPR